MYRPQHEKLEVYGRAVGVARDLDVAASLIPEARSDLRDQLRRASSSIVLNLAEGASEFSANDKARFYRIARRSGAECLAILDLVEPILVKPLPSAVRDRLLSVMETLDKLAHSIHRRRGSPA